LVLARDLLGDELRVAADVELGEVGDLGGEPKHAEKPGTFLFLRPAISSVGVGNSKAWGLERQISMAM
jgi:hypothetical protein